MSHRFPPKFPHRSGPQMAPISTRSRSSAPQADPARVTSMGFTPRLVRPEDAPGARGAMARHKRYRKVAHDEIAIRLEEARQLGVDLSHEDAFCLGLRALLDDPDTRELLRLELD